MIQITFLIALHFACSEKPVMLSGLHILMRGNSEASAILTASAVLPEPIGPERTRMVFVQHHKLMSSVVHSKAHTNIGSSGVNQL